ncbi:DUF6519 domain-containing protein [Methylobacter marinus]|uniref:DUF6519 domain-containing protein n=1 Tax=Methylobacter marinus TaxID=34058 RepID=UPI00036C8E11|nr:DUF6519 domain-containing protein [Methylobacter marinus]
MSADIERESCDPKKSHFCRVLHHQGRVLLASDLNEHGAIFQYYLRQFITDFAGKHWKTAGSFIINKIKISERNFTISKGHFYIDGILCDSEDDCWYSTPKSDGQGTVQPMFPTPEWEGLNSDDLTDGLTDGFAIYLECWERHVNWIQYPAIKEAALGRPDNTSRMEIAWQVRVLTPKLAESYIATITKALNNKILPLEDISQINNKKDSFIALFDENNAVNDSPCEIVQALLETLEVAEPKLRAWTTINSANETNPCSISPDAHYRGLKNQLYRVEIHKHGVVGDDPNTQPTCKWSKENGSVIFRITPGSLNSNSKEHTLELDNFGPDCRYDLCINDWVELINDEIEFSQKVLPLAKVTKIDSNSGKLTLTTTEKFDFSKCTYLRLWNQKEGLNEDGTIDIKEGNEYIKKETDDNNSMDKFFELEHGIKIQFQPGGNYHKGDYWLIPARVASGDILWLKNDQDEPQFLPSNGIKRHRAAIGVYIDENTIKNCGCVPDITCKTE